MIRQFYPCERTVSVYVIDWEALAARGIRGACFDIDNTLVPHDAPADEPVIRLFEKIHSLGIGTCLLSNNREPRCRAFGEKVKSAYIFKSGKPAVKGYRLAMERMGTDEATTVFVGDQLFTDIWGANRAGIYSILVKPIHPKEEIQIVIKRYFEYPVLWCYERDLKKGRLPR